MRAHAILSPSAAHRWLNCAASARLEEHVEDKGSDFAAEGTLAHAICEAKLRKAIGEIDDLSYREELARLQSNDLYAAEMDDHTDIYVAVVLSTLNQCERGARLAVERSLDLRKWMPDGFGTADAVIASDGLLEVFDFKYGKGVAVDAYENPQMKIYALGALYECGADFATDRVRMTIVQPRLDNMSVYEMNADDLLRWGAEILKPAAAKAYKGGKDAEQCAGDWCRFCKVRATCAKLAAVAEDATQADPRKVSDKEAARLLGLIPTIKGWATAFEEYALQAALAGKHFDGYKVVEGRSSRVISDAEALRARLDDKGYKADDYMKPAELLTLTALEKLCGKKAFAEVADGLIIKPQGKPTLVPESDKRRPLNAAADDFKNIDI